MTYVGVDGITATTVPSEARDWHVEGLSSGADRHANESTGRIAPGNQSMSGRELVRYRFFRPANLHHAQRRRHEASHDEAAAELDPFWSL